MNITVVHSIRVDRRMLPKQDRNRLDSCTRKGRKQTEGRKKNNQQMEKMETRWHLGWRTRGAQGVVFSEYYYLTLQRARLAVIVLRARIVAVESLPTCRAGATAINRVAFRSIETRTAIAAIGAPFVLRASCWHHKKKTTKNKWLLLSFSVCTPQTIFPLEIFSKFSMSVGNRREDPVRYNATAATTGPDQIPDT